MRKLALLFFSLMALVLPLRAEEVAARTRSEAREYAIGDWIPVRIELVHPKGAQFTMPPEEPLDGFQVITPLQVMPQGETHSLGTLVVARYEGGEATLPALTLNCMVPGEKAPRTLKTEALTFTIHTVNVDASQEIKDLKPPLAVPWTFREIALWVLAALGVLAALYGAYRLWKRRAARQRGTLPAPPPRPAHLVALEELAALQAKKLWQQGLVKEHHTEATEILRRYFEGRFHILALEQTTDEILAALGQQPGAELIRKGAGEVLRLADLVKFAKYQPIASEHERVVDEAREIVMKSSAS